MASFLLIVDPAGISAKPILLEHSRAGGGELRWVQINKLIPKVMAESHSHLTYKLNYNNLIEHLSKYSDKYGLETTLCHCWRLTLHNRRQYLFIKDDIHSAKGHKDASLESDHAMMCKYRDIDIGL